MLADQPFALTVSFFTATGIIACVGVSPACMQSVQHPQSPPIHFRLINSTLALRSSCTIDPSDALTLHWALFNYRHGPRDWLGDDSAALDRPETRVEK
ncbi:hypothetical protein F52700_13541 [Fusarium sp. NRRL 52700]|nr:hypothetical protein F52700_13541 [Fusarium sp. NRRL 52700]